jgi:tyrosine-protein phosphatase YwqE
MFNFFSRSKQPIKFWFTTDIHCHIIPGVDDGSPDAETSVQLIGDLADMGIKRILATPHIACETFENTPEILDRAQAELDAAMQANGMTDIRVLHAAENRIDDMLQNNMKAGTLLAYPNNYILIENSFVQEPWDLEQTIFDLQVRGYQPILAHPERYLYYHLKHGRYKELHDKVMFQVNVLSLAGYYGKETKKVAEEMMNNGWIDFLGTDTHANRHIECFREYLAGRDARRHRDILADKIKNDKVFE